MRTRVRIFSTALALTLFTAGCGGASERTGGGSTGGGESDIPTSIELADDFDENATYSWAWSVYVTSWDPIKSVTGGDLNYYYPVYDRLFRMLPDGEIVPMLAESHEEGDDGKSMTLTLRQGVTFSDGTPFNADAVKFNLDRALTPGSTIAGEVAQIESVEVVDEYTVKITVKNALGALLTSLAVRPGMMASPAAAQAGTLETMPVGIGPYVVTESVPGDRATYQRSENYWDPDVQRVASLVYSGITDDQARFNALRSGEVNGAFINPNQVSAASNAGLQVITGPTPTFVYFMVNDAEAPFNDPRVRKAINMAIDREGIAQGLYEGHCQPGIQPWPTTSPGYSEEIGDGSDVLPYDPEAAKKLMEEAGVTTPFEFTAITTNITQYQQLAEVLQANLQEIGLNMQIEPGPPAQGVEAFSIQKTALANVNPYTGIPDPHGPIVRYLIPGAVYNPGNSTSQELLDKAYEAAGPIDPAKRTPLYEEFMDMWVEEPPHLMPICMVESSAAYDDSVSGVAVHSGGGIDQRDVAVSG